MENRVKKKVLVVDDDVLSLKISRARLESAGYDVITSERAIGTLLIIIREKPDVILLDLNMPEIGGENFILPSNSKKIQDRPIRLKSLSNCMINNWSLFVLLMPPKAPC